MSITNKHLIFKKITPLFLFLTFFASGLKAQQPDAPFKIEGVVIAAEDRLPVIGAAVQNKEGNSSAMTDLDGKFSITGQKGETVVITAMGFTTKKIVIKDQKPLSIIIEEDTKSLEEFVVVGYGRMKRSDLTGSVASITSKDMERTIATTVDQALSGKIAGVQVTQNSGQPGGGVSVRIRGTNSLTSGAEPLYVVDGMQFQGGVGSTNPLATINPQDIVSIEVLKDASSAAIYGSNGANGVVLITTNRGAEGKTKVSYDGFVGWQQLAKKMDVLNLQEYARYYNDRAAVRGHGNREEFADPTILTEGTFWQDELFQTALIHSHQVSATGGNEKTKFFMSGGYLNQEGIALGSAFDRINGRMNIDNETYKWLKLGGSLMFNVTQEKVTTSDDYLIGNAINQTPDVPLKDANGNWGGPMEEDPFSSYQYIQTNPVANAKRIQNERKRTQLQGNAYADISIIKGLTFRNEIGTDINYGTSYYFKPSAEYGLKIEPESEGRRGADNRFWWLFKNLLYYDTKIDKFDLGVMLAHEVQENNWENLSATALDYSTDKVKQLQAADQSKARNTSGQGSDATESWFARLKTSYDERYYATFTIRRDGSSKFGPNNKWGTFPSVALAWRISQESFLKDVEPIENLKLRLTWGKVGNQNIDNYLYFAKLKPVTTMDGTGYLASDIANPNIRWEETESYNVGFDLNLFKGRIEIIAEAYIKQTKDLIIAVPLPIYSGTSVGWSVSGLDAPKVNVGSIQNKGVELTLNTNNINYREFKWRSGITFTLNKGEVKGLNTASSALYGMHEGEIYTMTEVGGPIGRFYAYQAEGLFVSEADFYTFDKNGNKEQVALPKGTGIRPESIWVGDMKWKDVNGDGVIDEKDRAYLGDPNPKFTYGFTNTFSYGNFDLTIDLQGVYGNKVYNRLRQTNEDPNRNFGLLKGVKNYAQIEQLDPNLPDGNATLSNVYVVNQGYDIPRISNSSENTNNRVSSLYVEDGSFLRIKNISLAYNLPKRWISSCHIEALRVYVNLQNLYTFTKYSGYDPEVGGSILLNGFDNGRYPSPRMYTVGLNLTL